MPQYNSIPKTNAEIIEAIVLSEEEIKEAITEGKRKKFFKERNKEHWNESEFQQPKKTGTTSL
jgi:hypothetical protein